MSKVNLSDLVNLQNETTAVSLVNSNSHLIETGFENTLSRDGTAPNSMNADFDMNSNRILNLPSPIHLTEPIRLGDVNVNEVVVTKSRSYSTKATAAASTIPISVDIVETLGYYAPGDNGNAKYARIPESTPATWRFQSADGQWWALNERILTPEMFGATAGADCTVAFQTLATYLNSYTSGGLTKGGNTVNFVPGADYKVWPAGTTPTPLFLLDSVNGVTFNFNGSRISTNNLFTSLAGPVVFYLIHCSNLIFNDPSYTATAWTPPLSATKWGEFISVYETEAPWSENIHIFNAYQNGGTSFLKVSCFDPITVGGGFANNFSVINADINNVEYGLNFQASGDNFIGRGIKMTNTGRAYFPYNVSNHDVEIIGDGSTVGLVNLHLKVYAIPKASEIRRSLSNIKLLYRDSSGVASGVVSGLFLQQSVAQVNVSNAVNNGSGLIKLTVNSTTDMATGQTWAVNGVVGTTEANGTWKINVLDATHIELQSSTFSNAYVSGGYLRVPVTIKNVEIKLDITANPAVTQGVAFVTQKNNLDGTVDTVTNNYTIENITISGSIKNYNQGSEALSLFTNSGTSTGVWTGETIRNINFRDLTITGTNSSVNINATPIQSNLVLENIWSTPTTIPWTLTGAGTNTRITNVSATGITDKQAVIPSTAGANQYTTGVSTTGAITYANASGLTAGTVTTNANLTGDVTSSGNATTLTNAPVIAKVLTGFSSSSGTISASDSILIAFNKADGNIALKAPLASPTFTGTPAAPTAAVDTNTTQIATTAMVLAQAASATPTTDAYAGVVGTSTRYARADHVHAVSLTTASNALGANVALNNTANYFDGPSMAQGTSGTWFASGTVTLYDVGAGGFFNCKLWDGTTVIAAGTVGISAGSLATVTLSGTITNPAGNIRISCKDASTTTGSILYNNTGTSKDAVIYGVRIG